MRQKFDGRPLDIKNAVPTYFEYCLHSMETPDSACPLLNEFVIAPFALEECRREGTPSEPGRMRPFSDAVTATATTAVATTVTSEQRESPCCSARPLAIGIVAVSMSFALIYFLMIVPLTTSISPTTSPPTPSISESGITTLSTPEESLLLNSTLITPTTTELILETTEDPLYQYINDRHHRFQIPLIHIPLLYEVKLKMFLPWKPSVNFDSDNFVVEGHVRVHFTSGGGSRVLLHSDSEQHVGECVVRDEFEREIFVKHVGRGYPQVLDLHLGADMIHGMNYTLDIAFRRHIELEAAAGLFAVSYKYENETRYVVATHLQTSEARKVFPCIDVPEVKAQFDTVIIHPTGTTAIANMIANSTVVDGGWTTTTFRRTPPMSTYLFALSVSDYPYLESFSSRGVRSRVYVDPSKLDAARILSESIGPVLDFYEGYFGIPYPLEKLDVVIVPALSVTAMENWGLITVRQADGLYKDGQFPITQKHFLQEIIAHEVSHQWFGNLVTMKWWNDLWLNEGFATLISVRGVDFLENSTWRYEDKSAELQCIALRSDQMDNMIPVSGSENDYQFFEKTSRINAIIYKKSSIIIRMIERLIEEDIFKQGLRRFLNSFPYKNADHEDLFNVLLYVHDSTTGGHLSGQNFSLSDVMNTWIRQAHFPIVHVNRKEGSIVTLRQEKYEHIPYPPQVNEQVWKIPIFYDDPVSAKHKVFWLTDKQPKVFDMAGQYVVDPHQLTYMRLRYDMEMYSDITMALVHDLNSIPANSRSRLIDDTMAMAEHGQLSYKVVFNVTMYMTKETTYRPFQTFSAYLDFFFPRMYAHESWPVYKEYLETLLRGPYDRFSSQGLDLDLDNETDLFHTRDIVVLRACTIGYAPCVQMAKQRFAELRKNCSEKSQLLSGMSCNKIPYYLRPHVYSSAIKYGTDDDFDFLFAKWNLEHYMMERDSMFTGLCNTHTRAKSDLAWKALLKHRARENILARAAHCSKRLYNDTLIMDMFHDEPEYLKELMETAEYAVSTVLTLVIRNLNTKEEVQRFDEILKPFTALTKSMSRYRSQVFDRMKWREEVAPYFAGNASEAIQEMKRFQLAV